jgi:hypothetical protein
LAAWVRKIGIHLVGTIMANKKSVPKSCVFRKAKRGEPKKPRGAMQVRETTIPGSTDSLYFIAWQDNKPVHLLSTIQTFESEVDRVSKEERVYTGGKKVKFPTIISTYNSAMGGTDYMDQMISYYLTILKTRKWQIRIFTQFLHVAVFNAHILYRQDKKLERGMKGFTLLDFTQMLIKKMSTCCLTTSKRSPVDLEAARTTGYHFSAYLKEYVDADGMRHRNQFTCRECKKYPIRTVCTQCEVPLCIPTTYGTIGCFEKYHRR